jgi:hypothetical protein
MANDKNLFVFIFSFSLIHSFHFNAHLDNKNRARNLFHEICKSFDFTSHTLSLSLSPRLRVTDGGCEWGAVYTLLFFLLNEDIKERQLRREEEVNDRVSSFMERERERRKKNLISFITL